MKKILKITLLIILCLFVLSIFRDQVIKSIVSKVTTKLIGAKVEIRGLSLSLLKQSVQIRDFKMYNPKGFSRSVMVDLPKINVDYDLFSLLKGNLHLKRLDIDLKELGLEKNKEDKLNVDSLKITQEQEQRQAKKRKTSKPLAMQIGLLNLQLGRIVYKDYAAGKEPSVKIYDIYSTRSYKNITSAQQLAVLILTEPMRHAGIKGAQIYALSALAGVGVLPVAIAATFISKDSAQQDFAVGINKLYDISLAVLKRIGKVNKEDRALNNISAVVNGADINVKLKQKSVRITQVTISARKYLLPKPEIARGILYQISEERI